MKKINGTTSWIMVIIAVLVLAYNTVSVHIIAQNEMKHVIKSVERLHVRINGLTELLIEHIADK